MGNLLDLDIGKEQQIIFLVSMEELEAEIRLLKDDASVSKVGQCGNQIGSVFWPLVLQEYGITVPKNGLVLRRNGKRKPALSDAFHSFFSFSGNSMESSFHTLSDMEKAGVKARALCIDMEDSVVARFRCGQLRHLFDDACFLTDCSGSGNNWAEGYYTYGRQYHSSIVEKLRRSAEQCDQLHGFLLLFSVGGGTGSGLGTAILSSLRDEFPHVERLVTCIYPAGCEDVVTAPYNSALATRELSLHADCVFPIHNKALQDICGSLLTKNKGQHARNYLHFQDMNSIVVNMLLNLTSGSRFTGSLNVDINELATNLVPFPKLQYITSSLSPLDLSGRKVVGEKSRSPDLIIEALSRSNQLLKMDPRSGVVLAAALLGRGAISMDDMRAGVAKLQSKARFVPWGSRAIKVGLCSIPPPPHATSVLALLNSSSVKSLFVDVARKMEKLYRRRAHVHHYLQVPGFEQSDLTSSLSELREASFRYSDMEIFPATTTPRLTAL